MKKTFAAQFANRLSASSKVMRDFRAYSVGRTVPTGVDAATENIEKFAIRQ